MSGQDQDWCTEKESKEVRVRLPPTEPTSAIKGKLRHEELREVGLPSNEPTSVNKRKSRHEESREVKSPSTGSCGINKEELVRISKVCKVRVSTSGVLRNQQANVTGFCI